MIRVKKTSIDRTAMARLRPTKLISGSLNLPLDMNKSVENYLIAPYIYDVWGRFVLFHLQEEVSK